MRPRILFVTPEAFPLVKTGGLGDYAGGLTKALLRRDRDVRLLLPGYPSAIEHLSGPIDRADLGDPFGAGPTALLSGAMPDTGAPTWLIDCPGLYARPGSIYQSADGADWPDNAFRFGLLARVAAWLASARSPVSWRPDLVHLNEWQTGPAAALIAQAPQGVPSLFTIHNMAFQGLFDEDVLAFLGLPRACLRESGLEFFGKVSFLKAGIRYADRVVTVSEAYAQEIQTQEFGFGLEGLLQQRAAHLVGILNGVDYEEWDPARDPHIAARFAPDALDGKVRCKAVLREHLGLNSDLGRDVPLLAYVSRLTHQKMADVLVDLVPEILARGTQVIVLGCGERKNEAAVEELARRFPGRFAAHIGYSEDLAHQFLAGADVLLAPARFEPCGLTQMYALRYATVPIVTRVGGLKETVVDADAGALASGAATGIVFEDRTRAGLLGAVERALSMYHMPPVWQALQSIGMRTEFSWEQSARRYESAYEEVAAPAFPAGNSALGVGLTSAREAVTEPTTGVETRRSLRATTSHS